LDYDNTKFPNSSNKDDDYSKLDLKGEKMPEMPYYLSKWYSGLNK
jgi:hypothetical protein